MNESSRIIAHQHSVGHYSAPPCQRYSVCHDNQHGQREPQIKAKTTGEPAQQVGRRESSANRLQVLCMLVADNGWPSRLAAVHLTGSKTTTMMMMMVMMIKLASLAPLEHPQAAKLFRLIFCHFSTLDKAPSERTEAAAATKQPSQVPRLAMLL